MQSHPTPRAHVCTPIAVLQAAEAFIAGFEDDRSQQGLASLLWDLRTAMRATPDDALTIAPLPTRIKSGTYTDATEFGWTIQAHWHRMRTQRTHGWPHEPCKTFVKASWYDYEGRLWQRAYPAVTDDFGDLVEVTSGQGGAA